MDALSHLSKSLIPGSLWLLLIAATAGVVLLLVSGRRGQLAGKIILAGTLGCYWLCSIPLVAESLQRGYPRYPVPPVSVDDSKRGVALVVLGAGIETYRAGGAEIVVPSPQSSFNILRGSQLYRQMGDPWVIVSGGIADASVHLTREANVLAEKLIEKGVPDERIIRELRSGTTHAQAINVAALAKSRGFSELVVITSPAHLRRTIPAFRAQGARVVGYPASFLTDRRIPLIRWVPTEIALDVTREAMYDYMGWVYYWGRGWLGPQA